MKHIEVCLTPEQLHHFDIHDRLVVVIDIFRATSCIVTALANGAEQIVPVAEVEECQSLQERGMLGSAERNGDQVEGFDFGNSPLSYVDNPKIKGRGIAMTTSNGTMAIQKAKSASQLIIGAFLNKTAVVKHILEQDKDVILLCAGWRGQVNLEDSVYAGALLDDMVKDLNYANDACGLARSAYHLGKNNPKRFLQDSSHFQRLAQKGRLEDIDFCLSHDLYSVVPVLKGDALVL